MRVILMKPPEGVTRTRIRHYPHENVRDVHVNDEGVAILADTRNVAQLERAGWTIAGEQTINEEHAQQHAHRGAGGE